jgi:hypothetical protein
MTQRQEFTVVKKFGDFEVREYMPCVLAEVKVSADYSSAGSIAFRSLFSYIAQGNSRAEKIAMTAPVIAATQDTTIDDNQWHVSFVMPAGATFSDLPDPNDPRVVLRDLDTEICVATSFRGRANQEAAQKKVADQLKIVAPVAGGGVAAEENGGAPGPVKKALSASRWCSSGDACYRAFNC